MSKLRASLALLIAAVTCGCKQDTAFNERTIFVNFGTSYGALPLPNQFKARDLTKGCQLLFRGEATFSESWWSSDITFDCIAKNAIDGALTSHQRFTLFTRPDFPDRIFLKSGAYILAGWKRWENMEGQVLGTAVMRWALTLDEDRKQKIAKANKEYFADSKICGEKFNTKAEQALDRTKCLNAAREHFRPAVENDKLLDETLKRRMEIAKKQFGGKFSRFDLLLANLEEHDRFLSELRKQGIELTSLRLQYAAGPVAEYASTTGDWQPSKALLEQPILVWTNPSIRTQFLLENISNSCRDALWRIENETQFSLKCSTTPDVGSTDGVPVTWHFEAGAFFEPGMERATRGVLLKSHTDLKSGIVTDPNSLRALLQEKGR